VTTPSGLLRDALTADPARPALTFYDDATGERVELSVTTLENWVAKTANLLVDGLGVHPGQTIGIRLPCHWLAPVWLLAAWSAGLVVMLGDGAVPAEVLVVGPGDVAEAAASRAEEVVAVSLRPMGQPFATPLPGRVLDYAAEVLGHGDRFVAPLPLAEEDVALTVAGHATSAGSLVALARARADGVGVDHRARLLTTATPDALDPLLDAALVPLLSGGVVLCRHLDHAVLDRRVEQERVSVVVDGGEVRQPGGGGPPS
jgi:uncharacterized protein (TIGR03089 family)